MQAAVEEAAEALTGIAHRVDFAGRTDAGVHATGQVGAFSTDATLPPDRWRHGLNHFLPNAVAVQDARLVPPDFDPRRDACARSYHYHLRLAPVRQPLWESSAWVMRGPLDEGQMSQALALLPGTRDFASFAGKPATAGSVRQLSAAHLRVQPGGYRVEFRGNAFLPHQVRRTIGQIVQIGRGKAEPGRITELLDTPIFGAAGPAAPPQGLYLVKVRYMLAELADWNDDNEDIRSQSH
ncbi:MAG: tRNA pseudouridine synthase [Chloroflexi bacterium]|nr:MAG: tRNA pseudouridine synthase [Chloroflexota bacterium]